VPLLACACEAAHGLGTRIWGETERGSELFERSGVAGSLVPLLLLGAAALVGIGVLSRLVSGRRAQAYVPSWLCVLAPLAAYVLQEELEHALAAGRPSPRVVVRGTFVAGLALQVPFALVALACCRFLFGAAERLRTLLHETTSLSRLLPQRSSAPIECDPLAPSELFGRAHRRRGPPVAFAL
jgi:hypothetical protein